MAHEFLCKRVLSPDTCQKSTSTDLQTLPFTSRAMSYTQKTTRSLCGSCKCNVSAPQAPVPWQYPPNASFRRPVQSHRATELYRAASDSLCAVQSIGTMERAASSVLVNPKDPHSMQLRQFGNEDSQQGHGVDHKMGLIVFGVETGEDV